MKIDHVLLAGFGAPEMPADLDPYLRRFAQTLRIPEDRLAEVKNHYVKIGGFSPYNAAVEDFRARLERALAASGLAVPVFTGMRQWKPFFAETLAGIRSRGLRAGAALVLAPHRSQASFGSYQEAVRAAAGSDVNYAYVAPWYDAPEFTGAFAATTRAALATVAGRGPARVIFCAHSIPESAAAESRYREEIESSARAVARELDLDAAPVAYHSQSERPGVRWIGPEVRAAIAAAAKDGARAVVLVPIGFLCENAEILYDLDVDARAEAEKLGLAYARAGTVLGQDGLTQFFARRIGEMNGNS